MIGKFEKFTPDYNLMSPQDMDELLFSAFDRALGKETRERIRMQYSNYEYYDGKQHKDKYGNLVHSDELERPDGLDYDPTRYATNYFKAIVDRKARWQMGGHHAVHVPRKQIDDIIDSLEEFYEPSPEQIKENERAENYEEIIRMLWRENKMRSKLVQAARDRLIADRAVCKIVFNQRTGKLRWIWRPDTEFIPIYSDDDFEDLIACHFVRQKIVQINGEDVQAIQKQTFRMIDDECFLEEAVYRVDTLEEIETITELSPMGLDFIPVVSFPVDELLGGEVGDGEIAHLREQNDILNVMNEDAIDSLKFEMFPITGFFNVTPGTAESTELSPGAAIETNGSGDKQPDIKKIESGFRWKEAFKDQYARVKGAMHEVSGLPQIVPQELNFGGLNGEALRILFHDIISDTEEHWLTWEYGLTELHEKSIRYLQARTDADRFAYDVSKVNSIDDYENEMKFVLPLPDNRKELVELLGEEMANSLESQKGAMERLGVDNVQAKIQEIDLERKKLREEEDPYGGLEPVGAGDTSGLSETDEARLSQGAVEMGGSRGDEPVVTCQRCGGVGTITSPRTGERVTCPNCKGDGKVQLRKR